MPDVKVAGCELQLRMVTVQWDTALPVGGCIVESL